jgi:hypothetical protein
MQFSVYKGTIAFPSITVSPFLHISVYSYTLHSDSLWW